MNVKTAPALKEVQEFQFKRSSLHQISEQFPLIPLTCSLVATDGKRGLLYIGHQKIITVLKLTNEGNIEWKIDLNLPDIISRLSLNCDFSLLAVSLSGPAVLIYSAASLSKNVLDLLHEIRLSSTNGEISVSDLRWNPAVPGMLCTVTSDYTIGSFQVSGDRKGGFAITGSERIQGVEALCVSWSPKGKQIVVGCQNGSVIQLKPELKVARSLAGPNPSMGSVIAILWVSNFQFCAAYQEPTEQRVSVLIVDAPKGETVARFTNYEDITYGGVPTTRFYFEYIPEWGVIIAASGASSEIAVLGTIDNGVSWEQWQPVDSRRAELPLVRTTETFPVGISIDRSSTIKLAMTAEETLPNPVPVLHIFGTSGALCSFHIINLKPDCPAICVPPSEVVAAPQVPDVPAPRPSLGSSEISFNLMAATSTPRSKIESPKEKPKTVIMSNFFAESTKVPSFAPKVEPEKTQPMNPPPTPLAKMEAKVNAFIQPEPKIATVDPPVDLKIPKPRVEKVEKPTKPEVKLPKEIPAKESTPEKTIIDDSLCLRAYREEQVNFEKQLKTRLEPLTWECGTIAEKEQLVEKTALIDAFLRDLQDTTTSLASDIAYLKGLLLQSFAWLEETKSKNSENGKLSSRNRRESSKLVELQKLFYYTQSQLVQASKVLDLQWSEQQSKEQKKMKIPSMECIYQSLMRHGQILIKERSNIESLTKKWKAIARGGTVSDLNRSLSNLQITSMNSSHFGNDSAIDLRCKAIANKTHNFSREKQMKLRDLLSESAPRIIKPAKPTLIQDRLEATLSSLASMSPNKISKPKPEQKLIPSQKPKVQSPLASLNSIVSKIGMSCEKTEINLQAKVPVCTSMSALPAKSLPGLNVSPLAAQKPKQVINTSFAPSSQAPQNLVKPFPKVDSISFGQKIEEKSLLKDGKGVTEKESILLSGKSSEVSVSQAINFSAGNQGSHISLTQPVQPTFSLQTSAYPNPAATAAQSFSFASKPAVNLSAFPFSSKPEEKSSPDLGGLNLSQAGITITPISEAKVASSNQVTSAMSSINFGKSPIPTNIFGASGTNAFGISGANTIGTTTASTFGTAGGSPFGANAFGALGASTLATSGASSFGTAGANSFATSGTSSFGTSGANTLATSVTSTLGNAGSLFGKSGIQGSIFGGNTTFASPLTGNSGLSTANSGTPTGVFSLSSPSSNGGLSSSTISSTTSVLGSPVTSSSPAISSVSSSLAPVPSPLSVSSLISSPFPPPTSIPPTSSVIVSKPISLSSPILASSLAQAPVTSVPSSVPISNPPPTYGSLSASLASSSASLASPSVSLASSSAPLATPNTSSASPNGSLGTSNVSLATPIFSAATANFSPASSNVSLATSNAALTIPNASLATPNVSVSSTNVSLAPPNASVASPMTPGLDMLSLSLSSSKPTTTVASSGTPFQTPTTTTSSIFSTPAFGTSSSATSTLNFGTAAAISSPTMIAPAFGKEPTSTPGSIFGGSTTTTGNIFGKAATTPTASPFGGNALAQSPSSPSIFGNAANSSGNSIFGGGSTTGTGFSTPATSASVFGMSSQPSVFGAATDTSLFGSAVKPQESSFSMFGGASPATGTSSAFGQAPAFGTKPAFGGNPDFGQAKSVFGTGFGAPPSFGSNPTPQGFGSPPMMGGSPPALGGASMQKVFGGGSGSNTFESLAHQSGGLSFSSLAQSSPEQQQQQKPPEFSAKSSFSSWR